MKPFFPSPSNEDRRATRIHFRSTEGVCLVSLTTVFFGIRN